MTIILTYSSTDGCRINRHFKTLAGAQRFAQDRVGVRPELGSCYAVSFDGIGKITVVKGATLAEVFPMVGTELLVARPVVFGEYEVVTNHHAESYDVVKGDRLLISFNEYDDAVWHIHHARQHDAERAAAEAEHLELQRLARPRRFGNCTCSDAQLVHVGCDCADGTNPF